MLLLTAFVCVVAAAEPYTFPFSFIEKHVMCKRVNIPSFARPD